MNLRRKQIKALLDVMGSDKTREPLTRCVIDKLDDQYYLVATDGYKLVALKLKSEINGEALENRHIKRNDLITYYKLADTNSVFNEQTIAELSKMTLSGDQKFPMWQDVYKSIIAKQNPKDNILFNANYLITMQILNDNIPINYKISELALFNNENNIYIVMGLKDK